MHPRMSTSRLGAWLGLFALLMLFAGPLLTQAQNLDLASALAQVQSELSCHSDDAAPKADEQAPLPHLECGYCQLAAHFAALPMLPPGLPARLAAPAPSLPAAVDAARHAAQLLPPPRAPPQPITA